MYSYDNWNKIDKTDLIEMRILTHLVKGNLYAYINKLLQFVPNPTNVHPWISKREYNESKS